MDETEYLAIKCKDCRKEFLIRQSPLLGGCSCPECESSHTIITAAFDADKRLLWKK